ELRGRLEGDGGELRERQLLEQPVQERPAGDLQQVLRPVQCERIHPGRVAGGKDEGFHATTTAGRLAANGGRCTPSSVTMAVISSAGVTSKAGFRAAKRELTSTGSRSSIGMSAPPAVSGSTVD